MQREIAAEVLEEIKRVPVQSWVAHRHSGMSQEEYYANILRFIRVFTILVNAQ